MNCVIIAITLKLIKNRVRRSQFVWIFNCSLCRVGVVSVSVSHVVGRGFVPCLGHTKDHQKMVQIASQFGTHALR